MLYLISWFIIIVIVDSIIAFFSLHKSMEVPIGISLAAGLIIMFVVQPLISTALLDKYVTEKHDVIAICELDDGGYYRFADETEDEIIVATYKETSYMYEHICFEEMEIVDSSAGAYIEIITTELTNDIVPFFAPYEDKIRCVLHIPASK